MSKRAMSLSCSDDIADSRPVRRRRRLVTLFNIQSGACVYCREPMTLHLGFQNTATLDHVISRSRGGRTNERNLVAACYSCNISKGILSVKAFNPAARQDVVLVLQTSRAWPSFLKSMYNPFLRALMFKFMMGDDRRTDVDPDESSSFNL